MTQEVFISAYRSLRSYRHDASFSTWLVKIATNKAFDFKKKKRHRITSNEQLLLEITNKDNEPLSLLVKKESDYLIKERVGHLPLIYQQVIQDHYYNQLTYQEIAIIEGVEVKTIESRLYRARSMLKSRWKEEKTIEL